MIFPEAGPCGNDSPGTGQLVVNMEWRIPPFKTSSERKDENAVISKVVCGTQSHCGQRVTTIVTDVEADDHSINDSGAILVKLY